MVASKLSPVLKTKTNKENKTMFVINISESKLYHDLITTDKETADTIFELHKRTASMFQYYGYSDIPVYRVTWRKTDVITKTDTP